MKIAILGARGIPACYSGYDTLVEELSTRLAKSKEYEILVYCRKQYYNNYPDVYCGVNLKYLSAPRVKAVESLIHSFLSSIHVIKQKPDLIYFVDPANAPFCLMLKLLGKTIIIHADGLGWKRKKWGFLARKYYKFVEWLSANVANALVTDNEEIRKYYLSEYEASSVYIPYGASNLYGTDDSIFKELGVIPKNYLLVVARLEPENNTDYIIEEYCKTAVNIPLIIVGDSPYNLAYFIHLKNISDERVQLIGRMNDQPKLNSLYKEAYIYLHGHSVGGTNPSLLRAMDFGTAPLVLDVPFNTSVIKESGFLFHKKDGSLANQINKLVNKMELIKNVGKLAQARARKEFTWSAVATAHKNLFDNLNDIENHNSVTRNKTYI